MAEVGSPHALEHILTARVLSPRAPVSWHLACQHGHPAHVGSRIQTTIRAASDLWDYRARAQSNSETLSKGPRVTQPQAWVRQYPHLSHSP